MNSILLINPPNLEEGPLDAHTIPLGLLYIKEFLLQHSFKVEVLNLFYEKNWKSVRDKLSNLNFNIIGIPCYTRQRFSVFELCRVCKTVKSDVVVILGGPHATFLDEKILKSFNDIDFVIRNEGEYPLLELLIQFSKKENANFHTVKGLTFRENGEIIKNYSQNIITQLSALPPPKYSAEMLQNFPKCDSLTFNFGRLKKEGENKQLIVPILASRGCNNNCTFCCNGAFWKKQVYYSPHYVFEQIYELYKNFGVRFFDFYDDDLLHSKSFVRILCKKIKKSGISIKWWCSSRSQEQDVSFLTLIKDAGCFMVSYGVESGSDKILNNIEKNISRSEIIKTASMTKQAGLLLRVTISIGHPGEDIYSIKETIKVLKLIKPDHIGLFLTKLYPGTPLYKKAKLEGVANDLLWFKKEETDFMFYTKEHTLSALIGFRNMIIDALKSKIVRKKENEVYSMELDLCW